MALAVLFVLLALDAVTSTWVPLQTDIAKGSPPDRYPDPMSHIIPGLNISECTKYYSTCLRSLSFINPREIQRNNAERFCVQQLHIDVCMSSRLMLNAMSMECGALAKSLIDSGAPTDGDEEIKELALAYQVYYYFCHKNHMYYQLNMMSPCFEEKYMHCILNFNETLCLRQCNIRFTGPMGHAPQSNSSPHFVSISYLQCLILCLAMEMLAGWAAGLGFLISILKVE